MSFKDWLLKDKENRLLLKWSLIAVGISFIWLKILYPYPNFMPPDSYSYLESASSNHFINFWAIGYSKFLRFLSSFTNSHLALVTTQYILLQICLMYLLFTIRYVLSPGKLLFRILLAMSLLNPLLPHIANFVSSDCLFTALSILWYAQLIWIIYKPSKILVLSHAFILLFAFSVRHNALYYPLLSSVVIIFSNIPRQIKWVGLISASAIIGSFIIVTGFEYSKKVGSFQYSAFGGWQLAANGLYGYAFSKPIDVKEVPTKFQKLHQLVNERVSIFKRTPDIFRPDYQVGIYYLWDFQSPLRLYMDRKWGNDTTSDYFMRWASMAPLYGSYGRYLISKRPWEFVNHYVWPNLQRYYAPPAQFMGDYNLGDSLVKPVAVKWFGWKNNKLPVLGSRKIKIAEAFTIITPILNIIFISGIIAFFCLGGFRQCSYSNKRVILITVLIWIANTVFSVFSAPIELRYQLFPLIINISWGIAFVGYITNVIYAKPVADNDLSETVKSPAIA